MPIGCHPEPAKRVRELLFTAAKKNEPSQRNSCPPKHHFPVTINPPPRIVGLPPFFVKKLVAIRHAADWWISRSGTGKKIG